MNYLLLLVLFSLFHSLSAQSYSSCNSYYYSPYYYYYSSNGALCCYKYSYRSSYHTTYYVYCPYYTYATTAPATTSISNDCNTYYYSYYYSSSCCYKKVAAYSPYYSSNYYYTTSDCDLTTTTTPAPTTCYYYYYSSYYGTKCCTFYDYSSSSSSNYDQYCPSTSTLSYQCGTSCCTASAPVYNGFETFYYSQYFCPKSPKSSVTSSYYCGPSCVIAAAFGTFGFCFCICGLAFTIGSTILCTRIFKRKSRVTANQISSVPTNQPTSAGQPDGTIEMKQNWNRETLPPQIPGYTYVPNPANTTYASPNPVQLGGATNVPPNPVYVPSVETHRTASYPAFPQPVQTYANDEDTYVAIN